MLVIMPIIILPLRHKHPGHISLCHMQWARNLPNNEATMKSRNYVHYYGRRSIGYKEESIIIMTLSKDSSFALTSQRPLRT